MVVVLVMGVVMKRHGLGTTRLHSYMIGPEGPPHTQTHTHMQVLIENDLRCSLRLKQAPIPFRIQSAVHTYIYRIHASPAHHPPDSLYAALRANLPGARPPQSYRATALDFSPPLRGFVSSLPPLRTPGPRGTAAVVLIAVSLPVQL